jgi:MFS transporter, DHA2 family, methylenomycin A resistance protein
VLESPERTDDDLQPAEVRPRWVLFTICWSVLIIGLNTTAMNTAIGAIAEQFDMGTAAVAWAVNGYLLAAAAFVAPGGQFGDVFARKRMYAIGLAIFAVGSVVIATAPDTGLVIVGRALQGTGSAVLLPAQLSLIRVVFPKEQQGTAVGIWAAVASLTFAIGPLYGGLFADTVGWRWMFWFDLVLLTVSGATAFFFLRPVREKVAGGRPDLAGSALLAVAVVLLVIVIQQGDGWGWTSAASLGTAAAVVALLVVFWFVEHHVAQPLVHFPLFRLSSYTGGVVTTFAQGFGLLGYLYFISIYVENYALYDYSPLGAGIVLIPGGIVMFLAALGGGRIADRIGYRIPNTVAMLLTGVGALALATVGTDTSTTTIALLATIMGLGVGIAFSTTSASGMAAVPADRGGEAAGVINVARYLGTVLVVSVGTLLATQVSIHDLNNELDGLGIVPPASLDLDKAMGQSADDLQAAIDQAAPSNQASITTAVQGATVQGFRSAQLMIVVVQLLAAVAAWFLFRGEARPKPSPP